MYFLRKAEKFRIILEFFVWIRIYIFQKQKILKNLMKKPHEKIPNNSSTQVSQKNAYFLVYISKSLEI